MKIVIDIPKYIYDTIVANNGYITDIADCDIETVGMAVKNGTPLPKEDKNATYCSDCIRHKVCGNEGVDDASMTFCADKQTEDIVPVIQQMKKVRAVASIKHCDGDDGRNDFDYIQYNCPKCGNRVIELDIACPVCRTFFDWEKIAKIKIHKFIIWE